MAILKLKNAGEELTLAVAAVEVVPATDPKMGAQVKFTDVNGDDLYVGESAVLRQLDRCGVADIADLAGQNIHFSRAANKNPAFPPYWNLDKARDGDVVAAPKKTAAPKTNGKPVSEYETPARLPGEDALSSSGFDAILQKYEECLKEGLGFGQRLAGKVAVTGDTVAAIAATLFIERNKRGV